MGPCQRRLAEEMTPLQQHYRQRRREMAFLIEDLLLHPPAGRLLSAVSSVPLSRLLVSLAASVLDETSSDEASDAPLKALHDRYSELACTTRSTRRSRPAFRRCSRASAWVSARKYKDSRCPR